jgi:hypothetical protein
MSTAFCSNCCSTSSKVIILISMAVTGRWQTGNDVISWQFHPPTHVSLLKVLHWCASFIFNFREATAWQKLELERWSASLSDMLTLTHLFAYFITRDTRTYITNTRWVRSESAVRPIGAERCGTGRAFAKSCRIHLDRSAHFRTSAASDNGASSCYKPFSRSVWHRLLRLFT